MSTLRRIAPGLLLLVLAPLIAEFLLGDLPIRRLPVILFFLPQYGGGALLIREVVRRTRRGWPSIVLLALAYALIEEGFTTQTFFNPVYFGQRLLDYGYIAPLGTSLNWVVFVVTLHVVWSISTPIAIAEAVAAERHATPWLRWPGLIVVAVLFVLGCALTTFVTLQQSPFVGSVPQLVAVAVLVVLAIVVAFVIKPSGRPREMPTRGAPSPWLVGACALVLGSAFWILRQFVGAPLPAAVPLLGIVVCIVLAAALVWTWSQSRGWSTRHVLALATGAVLTYAWSSLGKFLMGTDRLGNRVDTVDVVGQIVLVLAFLGLIAWAFRRSRAIEESA